jgi:TPR repeat protein
VANQTRFTYIHGQEWEYRPLKTKNWYEALQWLFNAAYTCSDRNWELWECNELGDGVLVAYAWRSEDDLSVTLTVVKNNS